MVVLWTNGTANGAGVGRGVLGAMTLLLGGYLLIHFFEHTIAPHFHFGEETHPEAVVRPSAAYTALGGLSIHTFFDGASVASAFVVDRKVGLLVFVAVLLHKVPEGFTAAFAWSPDGKYVYFARRSQSETELFRIPAAGGAIEPVGLRMSMIRNLTIHPDGKHIAFAGGESNSLELWALDGFL